jgi:hypothetical protein
MIRLGSIGQMKGEIKNKCKPLLFCSRGCRCEVHVVLAIPALAAVANSCERRGSLCGIDPDIGNLKRKTYMRKAMQMQRMYFTNVLSQQAV